ncbi:MAG: orotidine-5'-phosphate decarboxylase [Acidobacteriota bacterium]
MPSADALCVALDGSDRVWISATARRLAGCVGWLKIGLEAFIAFGPELVREVAATGPRVFLDVKLHDIPATVRRASANAAACGVDLFTVHAAGGRAMLEAAVAGAREGTSSVPPKIVAVTLLTSIDREVLRELGVALTSIDREVLRELGVASSPEELVPRWAELARDSGLDGVVSSPLEAARIRRECGPEFLIVTPGIRPAGSATDDQRRVLTPRQAIVAGADILVVGRPITRAPDPAEAAREILMEIESAN